MAPCHLSKVVWLVMEYNGDHDEVLAVFDSEEGAERYLEAYRVARAGRVVRDGTGRLTLLGRNDAGDGLSIQGMLLNPPLYGSPTPTIIDIADDDATGYTCFVKVIGWSAEEYRASVAGHPQWPFIMTCRHGATLAWHSPDDIPEVDTLMPCGHPNCWAIRYEKGQGNGV